MGVSEKLVLILFAASLGEGAQAGENDPHRAAYAKIADRNVFGLVAPGVYQEPDAPLPAAAKVRLTGITTILGSKRAFFLVQEPGGSGKAKEESYMLAVGQRQGAYELVEVDEKGGTAKLKADGKVLFLNLPSPKLPTAPVEPAAAQLAGSALLAKRPVHHPASEALAPPLPPMPLPTPGVAADN